MADDGKSKVKIIIIVLCFVGAAAGLYFAFGPKPAPTYTTGNEDIPEAQDENFGSPPTEEPIPTSGA